MMTSADIDDEIERIAGIIRDSPAYDPAHASVEQSIAFLEGVASSVDGDLDGLRSDLEK